MSRDLPTFENRGKNAAADLDRLTQASECE
jgi:hypothetical protein